MKGSQGSSKGDILELSPHELPSLPYPEGALEPVISSRTISFHYGKHHRGYADKLEGMIAGTELADTSLERIVLATAGDPAQSAVFNNAAQMWNHTFYWLSMKPNGGGAPAPGKLKEMLEASFGGLEEFKKSFAEAAVGQFGSGWAWLVAEGDKLSVTKTSNAGLPITEGLRPLLAIDVWEHAYYLDYQNRRPDYVNAVIEKLLDWEFALENLEKP